LRVRASLKFLFCPFWFIVLYWHFLILLIHLHIALRLIRCQHTCFNKTWLYESLDFSTLLIINR
jgi:hypothetical protein